MLAMRQILLGPRGAPTPPLPYDAEVEYLENTGTQWINTGVETTGVGFSVDVVASKTSDATSEMAILGRVSYGGYEIYCLNGHARLWTQSFDLLNPAEISTNAIFHVIADIGPDSQSISVDGNVESRIGSVTGAHLSPISIFRHNGTYVFIGRVYSCKIYDGVGSLCRDFIPVRFTNEQGQSEGAMYDRVSGQLFRNQGTGAFTIGPNKS